MGSRDDIPMVSVNGICMNGGYDVRAGENS